MIDGVNDEGYGDAVIYYRVGSKKAGAVESTLVNEFQGRLVHREHREKWYLIGSGDPAIRWVRSSRMIQNNKVPRQRCRHAVDIELLRAECKRYVEGEKHIEYEYRAVNFKKRQVQRRRLQGYWWSEGVMGHEQIFEETLPGVTTDGTFS